MSNQSFNLEIKSLPESIPVDVRKCFISTVNQILDNQNCIQFNKSMIRLNHMINCSFMVDTICKRTKGINNIDLVVGTTSALFHDIFKLFNSGDVNINIKGTDISFNVSDDDMLEDYHAELGSMFVKSVFDANKDNIHLDDLHIARICEAIKIHSDKYDEVYTKTDIQKILVEADIIEKIGLTTILKIFSNKPQLDESLSIVLSDKYQKFIKMRDVITTSYSIELYETKLNEFNLYKNSLLINKGDK